jgi:uncharacterized protein YraI
VRDGPDTTFPVLTTLSKGASVPVTGKVDGRNWYRISIDGAVGYLGQAAAVGRAQRPVSGVHAASRASGTIEVKFG